MPSGDPMGGVSIRSSPEGEEKRGGIPLARVGVVVSIRSSPEGEEKLDPDWVVGWQERFQSAPHPKVRRNFVTKYQLFNPFAVSIRSSPEGEEKHGLDRFVFQAHLFQSAPHPKVRRNDRRRNGSEAG